MVAFSVLTAPTAIIPDSRGKRGGALVSGAGFREKLMGKDQ